MISRLQFLPFPVHTLSVFMTARLEGIEGFHLRHIATCPVIMSRVTTPHVRPGCWKPREATARLAVSEVWAELWGWRFSLGRENAVSARLTQVTGAAKTNFPGSTLACHHFKRSPDNKEGGSTSRSTLPARRITGFTLQQNSWSAPNPFTRF